ncbi:SDR family NAD(P)-dependent oxidoreductase [Nakamurella silvestris]|nr:SDR family NAD(P)-dependent oxidoreductase [Nakamurella silvestris]
MTRNRWTAEDLPDLTGRTVVVTGASSGLGTATAEAFAGAGARVVLAVRNVAKGDKAAAGIAGRTEVRELDLGDLASVRRFAEGWTGDLDVLVNNAGIMQVPFGRTADGFELQIGTNHLGVFALTNLLLPHITDRVVTVSSDLARRGKIDLADLNWERRTYEPLQAYCQSKLANLLFTAELQRRLSNSSSSVRALSAHPGVSKTNLVSHVRGVTKVFTRVMGQSAAMGALPTLYAATVDLPGNTYVGPGGFAHVRGYPEVVQTPASARDVGTAVALWDISEELTKVVRPA